MSVFKIELLDIERRHVQDHAGVLTDEARLPILDRAVGLRYRRAPARPPAPGDPGVLLELDPRAVTRHLLAGNTIVFFVPPRPPT